MREADESASVGVNEFTLQGPNNLTKTLTQMLLDTLCQNPQLIVFSR